MGRTNKVGTHMSIRLYKYKPLKKFAHVADIIVNKRFYMTPYREFNDAMEGKYKIGPRYMEPLIEYKHKCTKEEVQEDLERQRVCCLCRRKDNPILWAHCADGFKGVCIEFNVVIQSGSAEHEFSCPEGVTFYPVQCDGIAKMPKAPYYHASTSRRILLQKMPEWSVEDEYRIISEEEYIPFGDEIKITRILLGPRIEPKMKPVWKTVFERLIDSDEVKVLETMIGGTGKIEVIE
jgi:hypothetical protein